jgi:hypothetical protein
MKEKKILNKFFFHAKIASGEALFPPLVKAKNQHQNFEKHLKQKRCAIRSSKLWVFLLPPKQFWRENSTF